jgi:glycosyltransferase involved in cell wall biosynthesis
MPYEVRGSIPLMRIFFDHQAFSLQKTGGITRYFYELINGLGRLNADVQAMALLGFFTSVWPMAEATQGTGRLIRLGPQPFRSTRATYSLNELVSAGVSLGLKQSDVYHSTLYRFLPSIRAKRRVATSHDCIHERFPELYPNHERVASMKRGMFARADLIFCVSEATRHDTQQFYHVEDSKLMVVHHGVAPLPRSGAGRTQLQRATQKPFVLYVGMRGLYKNFSGLLKAFAAAGAARDFDLLAIGGGAATDLEQREVASLRLTDSVKWLPIADSPVLAEAYASAALFVYPSLYEGFGMPPLEAMLAGCPTLVASNPATREVCKDASTFFDPHDTQDFTDRLKLMLNEESERLKNVERGTELAGSYSWERAVKRTLEGYRAIL